MTKLLSEARATPNLGEEDRRFGKAEGRRGPETYWKYGEDPEPTGGEAKTSRFEPQRLG